MTQLILITFALLGWTYWEMSGGADFVPEPWPGEERVAEAAPAPEPEPDPGVEVTRGASLPLVTPTDGADGERRITQARFLTAPGGAEGPSAAEVGPTEGPAVDPSAEVMMAPLDEPAPAPRPNATALPADQNESDAPGALPWETAVDAVAETIALENAAAQARAEARGQAQSQAPVVGRTALETPAGGLVAVGGDRVNMRSGPGTEYSVLDTLSAGTQATLVDVRGGWAMVELPDGRTGWMADYLLDGL